MVSMVDVETDFLCCLANCSVLQAAHGQWNHFNKYQVNMHQVLRNYINDLTTNF